ncbi:uncharacterized protein LOC120267787 [Dioscorea cayenensis subsp. rotundata]|uniref:Uncharacterized protein LOC120267787 n=1 Tax=Dioscorea cayennensis subsp. rotundata TaxID=55577 RepID=A0AB40BX53_DIOCR|nr:uncharacterized protein LOC120267787 [Dioscorea cayenensis subsp. rotundata]
MEVFHGGATAGGGAGEMRKLNLVYFLCRDGQLEHPHLIRVHHFSRHGVHLYDVKRWLADLRGKDMPDSYTWSYKRKYKNGYVWQDLMDDDLITPIADNEYVIKGSLLPPSLNTSLDKSKEVGEVAEVAAAVKSPPEILQIEHGNHSISPKPSPQLDQDSAGHTSILVDRREKPATVFRPEFTDLIEETKEGQEPFLCAENHAKKKMTLWSFLSCREVETDVPSAKPVNRRVAGGELWEEHDNGGRRSTMKGGGRESSVVCQQVVTS